MNEDTLIFISLPIIACLPAIIMGFAAKWRDDKADREKEAQGNTR